MNCNPTLTAEEFKVLHNSLCDLASLDDPKIQVIVDQIRQVALKGAYEQDRAALERKNDHYSVVQEQEKFQSIWSIYEIDDLNTEHPFPSGAFVVYNDHWGGKSTHCAVYGSTWRDIWRAADNCIKNSGDGHHIYIERFRIDNGNELHLSTGS